jgi:hypothetical protein
MCRSLERRRRNLLHFMIIKRNFSWSLLLLLLLLGHLMRIYFWFLIVADNKQHEKSILQSTDCHGECVACDEEKFAGSWTSL